MNRYLFLAAVLVVLGLAPAAAQSPAPKACHLPPTSLKGTVVAAAPEAKCRLALRDASGKLTPLLDGPAVEKLAPGAVVEVVGTTVPWQGQTALRVDEARAPGASAGAAKKYPIRGRCVHCGCRMYIESAAQEQSECSECNCKKKSIDCIK